ncbi:28S ribosomal protein S6, mitochondrial, partial [Varanus komodoensis]
MISLHIYAAIGLSLHIFNYEGTVARYQYFLMQKIESLISNLTDQHRELACMFTREAMQLSIQQLNTLETAAALKRTVETLMERGAVVRNLENLGERALPYRISEHNEVHTRGGYFLVDFHSSPTIISALKDHLRRDIDIVRSTIIKQHVKTEECMGIIPLSVRHPVFQVQKRANVMRWTGDLGVGMITRGRMGKVEIPDMTWTEVKGKSEAARHIQLKHEIARSSPWYTPELRAMKQVGRRLERWWRKSRDESDRTHLRAHYRAYAVAVRAAKKKFFSASIASSQCHLAELFQVVQGLVRPGPKKDLVPPSKVCCDDFAKHFREKIAQIRHELDSTIESDPGEVPMLPSGPDLMDEFQLLWPDDVDKVLGQVAVRPVLKKASLDPEVAANYRPVANIPFLGKVLEQVVAGQLQALLEETDYLDSFQSGFRP